MLYASTRNALTKHLGSSTFVDTIYATSKDDLTPEAYAAHKRHLAAPKPMSAREKEMADIKAAERQAGGTTYQGSSARSSPFGTGVGLAWAEDAQNAVKALADANEDAIVTMVRAAFHR
jgi:twinfilin